MYYILRSIRYLYPKTKRDKVKTCKELATYLREVADSLEAPDCCELELSGVTCKWRGGVTLKLKCSRFDLIER